MKVIGLTGGMACGKSTCSKMFRQMGIPVFDSDAVMHKFMVSNPDVIRKIEFLIPDIISIDEEGNKYVDRAKSSAAIIADISVLDVVVNVLVPYYNIEFHSFIRRHCNAQFVVMDVPLLFEGGWDKLCTSTVSVHVPSYIQHKRILARKNMTEEKMHAILDRQLPSEIRNGLSDFVVQSGLGKHHTFSQLKKILLTLS